MIKPERPSSSANLKRKLLQPLASNQQRQIFGLIETEPSFLAACEHEADQIHIMTSRLAQHNLKIANSGPLLNDSLSEIRNWLKDTSAWSKNKVNHEMTALKCQSLLGTQTLDETVMKLWRMLASVDGVLTKVCELQSLQLLSNDEIVRKLVDDAAYIEPLNDANGLTPFKLMRCLMLREQAIVSALLKNKRSTSEREAQPKSIVNSSGSYSMHEKRIQELQYQIKRLDEQLAKSQSRANYLCSEVNTMSSQLARSGESAFNDPVMLEQFTRLHGGYQRRMKTLRDEGTQREAELRKNANQLQRQVQALKWENQFMVQKLAYE